jgi:hypothetical protein
VSRMTHAAACDSGRATAAYAMRLPAASQNEESAPVRAPLVLGLDDPSRHVRAGQPEGFSTGLFSLSVPVSGSTSSGSVVVSGFGLVLASVIGCSCR